VILELIPNLVHCCSSCASSSLCPVLTPRRPRRDAILRPPVDPEETTKKAARPAPTPAVLVLPPPARIVAAARPAGAAATRPPPVAAAARAPGAVEKPKGIPVGAAAKKAVTKKATAGRPPLSPTSIAATTKKVQSQHLKRSLG
jgi:hypothetical protein